MLGIVIALGALALTYWLLSDHHKYWIKRGVKQSNPTFLFGDSFGVTFKTQSFPDMVKTVYNNVQNVRYLGFYLWLKPTLHIKDPELIKQIAIKDFDHFSDHFPIVPAEADPLWSNNLFALTGKKWRDMRTTLSPVFTSSKMKFMFSLISQNGQQFVDHFDKLKQDVITLEMKDTVTRFTNDVIANTVFGVECDSLEDRTNEFYTLGKKATDLSGIASSLKFLGFALMPKIFKILKIGIFSKEVGKFFKQLVKSNINSREKHNIVRPDVIHLLLEARKHGIKHEDEKDTHDTGFATVEESKLTKSFKANKIEITDDDITSQALVFFFGGFDSVSNLMCFMSYELGVHSDVQERLIEEVDQTYKACNGNLTYEAILDMKYMDMVVSEALRLWPNAIATDRICTKPYTIQPVYPDEKPLDINKGDILWLPILAIQRDPKYWSEPDAFDPERFSDENKHKITPYTYLPFGIGPRNCIGSRFALLETKVLFYYILTKFRIVPVEKTQIPIVLSKSQFNLAASAGFWFGLKRRHQD